MASIAWSRLTWSPALFVVLLLTVAWVVSLFLAPFTIPPETFADEIGGANAMDHGDIWATLPFYPMAVYAFGDIQCHQLYYRSFWLNGNQMPIDARMTSMYVFAIVGLVAAAFAVHASTTSGVMLNALPGGIRRALSRFRPELAAALVLVVALLPTAIDGFTQLFTTYESTNLTRVLTGAPAGFVGGLLVGAMFISMRQLSIEIRSIPTRAPPPSPESR